MERGRRTTHRNITTPHTTPQRHGNNHGWLASQSGYLTAVVTPPLPTMLSLEKLGGRGGVSLCHEGKARGGWLFFSSLLFSSARPHWLLLGYVVFDTKPYQTCCCC